jgi:negative regulator of sigma E activity
MNSCIDEGTLQAWLDGELADNEATNVAAHLNVCARCAATASEVRAENLILAEALAPEFAAAVPTESLRHRVDSAVAGLNRAKAPAVSASRWSAFTEFFGSWRPLAYASAAAIIVLAAIIGIVYFKNQQPKSVANANKPPVVAPAPKESPEQLVRQPAGQVTTPGPSTSPELAVINSPKPPRRRKAPEPDATSIAWQARQYENAIARLDDALKTQPAMRPALQVEYEYNLAVIDSAIATTRDAAKKNPKDPLVNQFMLAAYQSKVDFMNQIADARGLEK